MTQVEPSIEDPASVSAVDQIKRQMKEYWSDKFVALKKHMDKDTDEIVDKVAREILWDVLSGERDCSPEPHVAGENQQPIRKIDDPVVELAVDWIKPLAQKRWGKLFLAFDEYTNTNTDRIVDGVALDICRGIIPREKRSPEALQALLASRSHERIIRALAQAARRRRIAQGEEVWSLIAGESRERIEKALAQARERSIRAPEFEQAVDRVKRRMKRRWGESFMALREYTTADTDQIVDDVALGLAPF
jgi:hypothetical protein